VQQQSESSLAERARRQIRLPAAVRRESGADAPFDSSQLPVTVIEAAAPRARLELRELWRARDLALTFAWRDVKVRYKQSLIGIAWAVIQPFLTMVVFTLVFGKFANFPSQGLPYQAFVYLGLLPWALFASSLTQISSSVLSNRQLVQKVYFPRLILPISGVLVPVVDFLFSSIVLVGILFWFHVHTSANVFFAPLFLVLLLVTALGVGAVFAAINVRYRDVPYVVPFLIQIWLYVSPVIYPTAALPEKYETLSSLNPVVPAITGFRWALAGTPPPSTIQLALGISFATVLVTFGFWFYRRWESRFADTI
jgi:homopolymeric O-antigen transport system permease protein